MIRPYQFEYNYVSRTGIPSKETRVAGKKKKKKSESDYYQCKETKPQYNDIKKSHMSVLINFPSFCYVRGLLTKRRLAVTLTNETNR